MILKERASPKQGSIIRRLGVFGVNIRDIEAFKQGKMNIEIENTYPAHVFEIHPVTKIDAIGPVGLFA
jgi:hypothetical protein